MFSAIGARLQLIWSWSRYWKPGSDGPATSKCEDCAVRALSVIAGATPVSCEVAESDASDATASSVVDLDRFSRVDEADLYF